VGAVRHLIQTFFAGSHERAIHAILSSSDTKLSRDEVTRIEKLIAGAQRRDDSHGR
jgi:hypothetical protein